MSLPLAARVILPDGRRGYVVAGSCDEPIVAVKTDDGHYVTAREDELSPEPLQGS